MNKNKSERNYFTILFTLADPPLQEKHTTDRWVDVCMSEWWMGVYMSTCECSAWCRKSDQFVDADWINVYEWMRDGWNRAKIKVWNLLYIVLKLCPSHFKLWIVCSWIWGFFEVNPETKTDLPTVSPLSHEITVWQQHTKWISTCKAIVHSMCNEVSDWVVRSERFSLWIWTSSITSSSPSSSRLPKVCLLLLCTYSISYYDL